MAEKDCHHSRDLDILLQGYTYVHGTNKNTDSTESLSIRAIFAIFAIFAKNKKIVQKCTKK